MQRRIFTLCLFVIACGSEQESTLIPEELEPAEAQEALVVITAPPPGSPEALLAEEEEAQDPESFFLELDDDEFAEEEPAIDPADEFIEEEFHDHEYADEGERYDTTASGLAIPVQRPHWGSGKHGDNRCSASSHRYWSTKYNSMSVFRWGGCHATVYYRIGSSIRARGSAWVNAVDRAFATWDLGRKCSPHWVNITRAPAGARAKVEIEMRGRDGHCHSDSTWYACVIRDRAASTTDQHWWMNINTAVRVGVGTRGKLDLQSLVSVELAHILYFAHNPNYTDSISTANTARWGAGSATVSSADSCSIRPYTATCANCGNRRALRTGDRALLNHLYANHTNGCTTAGQRQYGCGGESTFYRTCRSNHTWSSCTAPRAR